MREATIEGGRCTAKLFYGSPNTEVLRTMPDNSVDCVVTSPPYWGLRDYEADGQLGLEPTPDVYVEEITEIFREVRRVLKDTGTLWLNLGDTYLNKQLLGVPWKVAFALQADGWWLRQEIIWHKPNPMPESVTDRCTKASESIFLLAKSSSYFFDATAIREENAGSLPYGDKKNFKMNDDRAQGRHGKGSMFSGGTRQEYIEKYYMNGRNRRSVWTITTQPFSGAHFAAFPEEIPRLAILAGTSDHGCCTQCRSPFIRLQEKVGERQDRWSSANSFDGYRELTSTAIYEDVGWAPGCDCDDAAAEPCVVLDPFSGSGTTGKVALRHGRSYIGIDLNEDYLGVATRRVSPLKSDVVVDDDQLEMF